MTETSISGNHKNILLLKRSEESEKSIVLIKKVSSYAKEYTKTKKKNCKRGRQDCWK